MGIRKRIQAPTYGPQPAAGVSVAGAVSSAPISTQPDLQHIYALYLAVVPWRLDVRAWRINCQDLPIQRPESTYIPRALASAASRQQLHFAVFYNYNR